MRYLAVVLVAATLVTLVPSSAAGQGFTIGLKGGLNVSTLSVDDPSNPELEFDSQTDFLAGAFIQCGGIGWFTLQGEVLYSQNGAKVPGEDPEVQIDLNYIRVPILFMARLASRESPMYPILYAGPQVALQTRCGVSGESDGVSASFACDSEELDEPLETNNVEFGVVFGGGFEVLLSKLTVQLDARYNLGLTNINGGTDASTVSVHNRGWSFALGLGMPFGSP
jgi:hypothetical protein